LIEIENQNKLAATTILGDYICASLINIVTCSGLNSSGNYDSVISNNIMIQVSQLTVDLGTNRGLLFKTIASTELPYYSTLNNINSELILINKGCHQINRNLI
jgi:hypothetical protein